jgi:hypothetical protein
MKLIGILLSLAFLSLPAFAESELIPKTEEGAFGEKVFNCIKATDLDCLNKLLLPESEFPGLLKMLKIPEDQINAILAEEKTQRVAEQKRIKELFESQKGGKVPFKDLKIVVFEAKDVDRDEVPLPEDIKALEYRINARYISKEYTEEFLFISFSGIKLNEWSLSDLRLSRTGK